jgi:hypothetical protein
MHAVLRRVRSSVNDIDVTKVRARATLQSHWKWACGLGKSRIFTTDMKLDKIVSL